MRKQLEITENIKDLMVERYYYKKNEETTPQHMIRRVSNWVAQGEKQFGWSDEDIKRLSDKYYDSINERLWIPSSPFLMNGGTDFPMAFACFVVGGLDDNRPSIYETLQRQGHINALGGGTGFYFGKLREEGSPIKTTGGTSSGVMSIMDLYNTNAEFIKQGGRRRSANMGVQDYFHPEIMKFIKYKQDQTKLTNFNISVLADKEFFELVENDGDVKLVSPNGNKVVGIIKAREIHDAICYGSWKQGDPAYLFKDNMNKANPMKSYLGWIVTTNPCGEVILYPDEACILASINLEEFVSWNGVVDWVLLRDIVRLAVRFLDTSIDINLYPDEKIEAMVKNLRRIGLGIMSLHGAIIKAGYKYSSADGREFAGKLMKFVNDEAIMMSMDLADEKGAFPLFNHAEFTAEQMLHMPWKMRRNVAVTTIAPTGTIQQMLNTSSGGCEPMFAIVYRRLINGVETFWVNPFFKEYAERNGFWTEELPSIIHKNKGSVVGVKEVPQHVQDLFETAMEMHYNDHIYMQAELQKYVENSISKTINMPNNATQQEISDIFILGHKLGLKGMTVYRDGSREGQVLSVGEAETSELDVHMTLPWGFTKEAPDESTDEKTVRVKTGCGTMYLTMTRDEEGAINQTFVNRGSKGTCMANQIAVSRLISLSLRSGVSVEKVVDQLKSIPVCASYYGAKCSGKDVSKGSSCPSAIAFELEKYAKEGSKVEITIDEAGVRIIPQKEAVTVSHLEIDPSKCPRCGEHIDHEGGCTSCKSCGYSGCSV